MKELLDSIWNAPASAIWMAVGGMAVIVVLVFLIGLRRVNRMRSGR